MNKSFIVAFFIALFCNQPYAIRTDGSIFPSYDGITLEMTQAKFLSVLSGFTTDFDTKHFQEFRKTHREAPTTHAGEFLYRLKQLMHTIEDTSPAQSLTYAPYAISYFSLKAEPSAPLQPILESFSNDYCAATANKVAHDRVRALAAQSLMFRVTPDHIPSTQEIVLGGQTFRVTVRFLGAEPQRQE